jgi:hypothetical protein
MKDNNRAIILIGHGGFPTHIPSEIIEKIMRIHKARIKTGGKATTQEVELDNTIRR